MKILVKGKVETVSLDRVKPAHLECEPTTGTTIQRKTPNKPQKSTATRTSSRNPQGPPRTGSADTPTSNGTSVKTKKSTAVRSSQKSATVPKQLDVKVNLSNRDKTYVAPHSRAPAEVTNFYNPATCTKQSPTRQLGPTLSLTRG